MTEAMAQQQPEPEEQQAQALARALMSPAERIVAPQGFYVADLHRDVEHFGQLVAAAESTKAQMLCFQGADGAKVPVDVIGLLPTLSANFHYKRTATATDLVINAELFQATQSGFTLETPEEAKRLFRVKLIEFLTIRFKNFGEFASGSGLHVTVYTRHPGDRVEFAPCYFHASRSIFGAPTSPVTGLMQPGRYSFATAGPKGFLWDAGQFNVPPLTVIHLQV